MVVWLTRSTPFLTVTDQKPIKPPRRQAEGALILLDDISDTISSTHENAIRRALERLRELENGDD